MALESEWPHTPGSSCVKIETWAAKGSSSGVNFPAINPNRSQITWKYSRLSALPKTGN